MRMRKQYLAAILLALTLSVNHNAFCQNDENYTAKDYFEYKDYNRALVKYLKLYDKDKNDLTVNLQIGLCYLKVNDDKTKAIPYLEYVYNSGNYDNELLLYLGMAYMYNYELDKSITFFNTYLTKNPGNAFVNHQIENCESAKALIKKPIDVTFENLGKKVNGKYPDYSPFITKNQEKVFFTSSRVSNPRKIKSSEGYYTADVYYSKVKLGAWGKAKSVGPAVNTAEDEQCVYVTPDARKMIIYIDNLNVHGNLFFTERKGRARYFPKPVPFNKPVNTKSLELEGCITTNGNTLIISSNRTGGFGETDLYKLKKLPNGEWGIPVNLGDKVNSKYKDGFPVFDEKNQTLYFSSKGHTNMGGFDIFKSKYNPQTQTFGEAINMGFPINTPGDNIGFSITENGRDGYMAAVRKEGFGDLDIYKIVFNDVENITSVIKGTVSTNDSLNSEINAFVTLVDERTKEEIESKDVNQKNGTFIFAVNPGKYIINITSPGYNDTFKIITVFDKSSYVFKIETNIVLIKKEAPLPPDPDEETGATE